MAEYLLLSIRDHRYTEPYKIVITQQKIVITHGKFLSLNSIKCFKLLLFSDNIYYITHDNSQIALN